MPPEITQSATNKSKFSNSSSVRFTIGYHYLVEGVSYSGVWFSLQSEILQEGMCSLQHDDLNTGDALEALHGCLDPSILSIFEDSTNREVKPCFITYTEGGNW